MKWFLKALKHYADFSGRARRKEYWMFTLYDVFFSIVWGILTIIPIALSGVSGKDIPTSIITSIIFITSLSYSTVMLLPRLAVAVRRLHDTGKSGWMLLVGLIPAIGGIWLFVLMLLDSQTEANKYGTNPKTSPEEFGDEARMKSVGVILTFASAARILQFILEPLIIFMTRSRSINLLNFSTILHFAAYVALLTAGILLLNKKATRKVEGKTKNAIIAALAAVAVLFLLSVFSVITLMNPGIFTIWPITLTRFIGAVHYLTIILLAVSLLLSPQNRGFTRSSAVLTIVFSGLFLLWSALYPLVMSITVFIAPNSSVLISIFLPIAFIVLAGTFYPEENLSGETRGPFTGGALPRTFQEAPVATVATKNPDSGARSLLHVRFNIDSINGGAYGMTCYKIIFTHAPVSALCGCTLSMGDSKATLAGHENVCVIGVAGAEEKLTDIMRALRDNPEFKSVCAVNPLALNDHPEPLVADGVFTEDGGFLKSWAKMAFDSVKKDRKEHL